VTTTFRERTFSFFSLTQSAHSTKHAHYFIKNDYIVKQTETETLPLIMLEQLPSLSFTLNWVILVGILDMLSLDPSQVITKGSSYHLPEHRIDTPLIAHGLYFYNDSKSTLMQATLAAVAKMETKPILLLGGLSKGVDRRELLPLLKNKIKKLVCFGKEAEELAHAAQTIDISASAHATLDEAFTAALTSAQKNDCILLSPGGSSYDLFTDYKARGTHFEELVKQYGEKKC
jgi:UDP-N-acetylmuramoylalanine--D-glutamate ligase